MTTIPTEPIVETSVVVNEPVNSQVVQPVETDTLTNITTSKAVEVPIDVAHDPVELRSKVKDKQSSIGRIGGSTLGAIICGSRFTLIILGISAIITIIKLYIGWHYVDECRIDWRIPHYLVISGIVGLVSIVLGLVDGLLGGYVQSKSDAGNVSGRVKAAACGICGISIVVIGLMIFLLGWFIAGCIWVFRAWNKVQYTDPDEMNYCNRTLYRFAFWLLLISIIYYIFSFIRSCCQGGKQFNDRRKLTG